MILTATLGDPNNSSGIYSGSHDEQLSELLSASQLAHIYKDTDYLEPSFMPLKSALSSVSDLGESYLGDEQESDEESESSENVLFTCVDHSVCFAKPVDFESHQLESHMDE